MSNRLTFSLASLVLIFALVFAAMPVIAHESTTHNNGADGHPTVEIMEGVYTTANAKSRSNFRVKIVAKVDGSTTSNLFDSADDLTKGDLTIKTYTADGTPGSVNIDQHVSPTNEVGNVSEKHELEVSINLSTYPSVRSIDVIVNADTVNGNRQDYEGGNEATQMTFDSLPSLLALTAELEAAAKKDTSDVAIPGRYTLTVKFKSGDTLTAPDPAPTVAEIAVTPKGDATPVNSDGVPITDMTTSLTQGETGVYTQDFQLTFGKKEATLGLISGYAKNAPTQKIPPPVKATQNPPAAMITVSAHDAVAKTFRVDVTFTPAVDSLGDPGTAITKKGVEVLKIVDKNDADAGASVLEPTALNEQKADNSYKAILQYSVFADPPLTITIDQAALKTSNPTHSVVVGETDSTPTAPAKPAAPTAAIDATNDLVINVSWTAPDTGGSAITGYTVKQYEGTTLVKTFPETGQDAITGTTLAVGPVSAADRGKSFTFTVTATNTVGSSDESDKSAAVMIPSALATDLPAVTNVMTTANANGSVGVTWQWTGTADEMAALDGFTISVNPEYMVEAAARSFTIPASALTPGTAIEVAVKPRAKADSGFTTPTAGSKPPAPVTPLQPPVNNAPAFATDASISPITGRVGISISTVFPPAGDWDPDDTLTYSIKEDLPAGLTFAPATRTLSGTPTAASPTTAYTYVASDGTDEATLSFVITVAADNPPPALNPNDPRVAALIKSFDMNDGKFVAGMKFSARFPIVTDPDGDPVTYDLVVRQPAGATLADYYLMFDPTSRTLSANANPQGSGTSRTLTSHSPSATEVVLAFIVSSLGLSVDALTISMQLDYANHAPAFANQDPIELTFTKGVAVKQGLPLASDEDSVLGDKLTYSLTPALPSSSGLTLDVNKAEISGTPSSAMSKTGYQLTATDATIFGFKSEPVPVYITVVDPSGNKPPAFAVDASISDITATVGSPIEGITLPKATDDDGDAVSYTLTSSSSSLGLMGLNFDSSTRRLTGTPSTAGTVNLTYTAEDTAKNTDKLSFSVTVMPLKPATIEIPTANSSSAPIPLAPQFNPTIPAHGFAVLVRDVDGSGTYAPLPNTWKRSIDTPLPDLAWFFGTQPDARGGRTNGGTIALNGPGEKKDLVISEVMWGTDSSLAVPARSQWIEFYNATPNDIDLTGYTITFHRSQVHPSAWANARDIVSNVSGHSIYFAPSELPGQSGRSNVLDSQGRYEQQRDLVSMYRQIDHVGVRHYGIGNRGERDKRITGWAASMYPTANIQPVHIATPGAEQISHVTISNTTFSQSVIINEIGNSANDDYDWIELHNTTNAAIKLRKWDFTMIVKEGDVGKEKRIFQFPDNDTVWVPANGFLVIARTHPRNDGNDLAAGIDVTKAAIDQLKRGLGEKDLANHPTAYYYVNSGLVLPNDTTSRLFVLRNANDKHGQPSHVVDTVGTLSIEVRGDLPNGFTGYAVQARQLWNTATWPFQGAGGKHGNVIDGGDEDFRAGKVYQRNGKNSGIGEKHLAVRGYTGVGYDRHAAVNGENGGTPGYHKDVVKGDKSNWANQVTFSEVMLVTEEGEGAGRVPRATRLPQWVEIYNASLTEAVSINNWYLEVQNDDTPDFFTNLHGTLRLPNVIIQPNQTVLIVSNSGLNSGNFPEQRTINVFTNGTYRQILGLTRRGEPMLNPKGFYIELRDHKGNSVDEIGNLGVSRRTGTNRRDNFGEQWEMPSLHSQEGHRTSLIRIYDNGVPRSGLNGVGGPKDASTSWTLASSTNFQHVPSLSYYGNHRDFGTPGYRGGGPLPVSLSKFRPERLDSGEVVIRWVTESELNNAGFNILRSDTRGGEFTKVNTQLIKGQGTTSERTAYEWKDTTAKPNVAYYYQIQDVSLDGQITTLRVNRLKGNVTAAGKATTTWGKLKALQ